MKAQLFFSLVIAALLTHCGPKQQPVQMRTYLDGGVEVTERYSPVNKEWQQVLPITPGETSGSTTGPGNH